MTRSADLAPVAGIIHRSPDVVRIETVDGWRNATGSPGSVGVGGITVETTPGPDGLTVAVRTTGEVSRVWLRWRVPIGGGVRVLGDAWERSYADLEWRGLAADRPLPWYAMLHDSDGTAGVGVRTGPAGWCAFSVDRDGVGLLIDLRSGAVPARPGDRVLAAATVVSVTGDDPYDTTRALCRRMCPAPVLPGTPIIGGNNWYHAYGRSSADQMLAEADLHVSLSPTTTRPYVVIDDGWEPLGSSSYIGGPWDSGNERFADPGALAARMTDAGAHPGLWFRPLLAPAGSVARPLRSASGGDVLDPSLPEVQRLVATDVARMVGWGYRLIKHDFTTYDVTGRWGRQMGWDPVDPQLRFADRTRTTVEILDALYAVIAEAAAPADRSDAGALVLGCNTVGHLAAGRFALQRTGDDTSGRDWARTRAIGVNTLAFRLPQHDTFFAVDADCVGITPAIDWADNRAWLDLVARSGTALFVSVDPATVTAEQRADLTTAYAIAAAGPEPGRPIDWLDDAVPSRWQVADGMADYDWYRGAAPPMLG